MKITSLYEMEFDTDLSELEVLFKEYFSKYPDRHLELPHKMEASRDIIKAVSTRTSHSLPKLMLDSLTEGSFISKPEDAAVYRHVRYLPAVRHSHDFFEVACLFQGQCTNYIAEQKIDMIEGDICIIAPNTSHAISAFSDDCILFNILLKTSTFEQTFLDVMADTDLLAEFFTRTLYHSKSRPYLLFRTHDDPNPRAFIWYAYDEAQNDRRYKRRMMNSIISALFAGLLRAHEKDVIVPSEPFADTDNNLVFILRYMQENFRTITLKNLSDFFNYSERHLQRIIKAATGMSFSENIQKLKMTSAANMLEKGDATINEISEKLGYSTVNNFRNIFKKYYGMTPAEFRNFKNKD